MEVNLELLKKNFITIKDIRNKVTTVFQILENHLKKLKHTYSEFVINNKQNLFVFGLDSFQFQSKLIDIEYNDMQRLFFAINNRMYCEYYKLYKIIVDYVKENVFDKKSLEIVKATNNFPVYKDLEPYKQYDFQLTQEIHENIILLLYGINEYIVNKESELDIHKKKQASGLNINNFVTTFNYSILMTKEKGLLFISYIDFFHTLHTKYLQRFAMKMNLMYSQVTHDIRFDDNQNPGKQKRELINNFQNDKVDNLLIKQIRHSFDDSETNTNSNTLTTDNNSPYTSLSNSQNENDTGLDMNNVYSTDISNFETEKPNSSKRNLKHIFTKNVKKIMGGIFKTKKEDVDTKLETFSSDNSEKLDLLKYKNLTATKDSLSLKNIMSLQSQRSKMDNNITINVNETSCIIDTETALLNPITPEDALELNKSLSQDYMFLEITNQCNQIMNIDFEKDNDIGINLEDETHTYTPTFLKGDLLVTNEKESIQNLLKTEELNKEQIDDNMSIITMESVNITTEEVTVEEVKNEEVTVEEVKNKEVTVEEVIVEEVKTEEATVEEVKNEEVKTEEVTVEEVKTEEVKTEEIQKQEEQKKRSYKPKKKK